MEIEWKFSKIWGKMASPIKWETGFVLVQIEIKLAPRLDRSLVSAATWLRILRSMPRSSSRTEHQTGLSNDLASFRGPVPDVLIASVYLTLSIFQC